MKKAITALLNPKMASRKPSEMSTLSETSCVKTPINTVVETEDDEDSRTIEGSNVVREELADEPTDEDEVVNDETVKPLNAPTAKVIVSDEMMAEAMTEINSRRSSRSLVRHTVSDPSGGNNVGTGGDGDASTALRVYQEGEEDYEEDARVSALEKVLEFLQAVMAKEYERALELAHEVETLEPNNALIKEYKDVLGKIVQKEKEEEEEDSDSDKGTGSDAEYTDVFSSSSETESMTGKDSSGVSHSSTFSSSSESEEESDEDRKTNNAITNAALVSNEMQAIVRKIDDDDGPSLGDDELSTLSQSIKDIPKVKGKKKTITNNNAPIKNAPVVQPKKLNKSKANKAGGDADSGKGNKDPPKGAGVNENVTPTEGTKAPSNSKSKPKKKLVKKTTKTATASVSTAATTEKKLK